MLKSVESVRWVATEVQRRPGHPHRGNAAILYHRDRGKELHLFVYVSRGSVLYEGQFEYEDHDIVEAADLDGHSRKAIVFKLRQIPRQG